MFGRTIAEPEEDEDEEEDGGGEAKPLLNIDGFRYGLPLFIGARCPTILRGGTPENCIGGGTAAPVDVFPAPLNDGGPAFKLFANFVVDREEFIDETSDVISSEIRSKFHQKSLLRRVIHALSSRNK